MKRFLLILGLCLIGLIMSVVLAVQHYQAVSGDPGMCVADTEGCGSVLNSDYSELFGIPVGTWGALYFLAVIAVLIIGAQGLVEFKLAKTGLLIIGALGAVGSIAFIGVMAFILHKICSNCMIVHTVNIVMVGLLVYHFQKSKGISTS